jgi:hypothetical protein
MRHYRGVSIGNSDCNIVKTETSKTSRRRFDALIKKAEVTIELFT